MVKPVKILLAMLTVSASLSALSDDKLLEARFHVDNLMNELTDERKNTINLVGLSDTVHMCSMSASESAYRMSNRNNISIKRVSLRPRNIGLSTADIWEQKALIELSKKASKEYFSSTDEPTGKFFRYAKPLIVKEGCLTCHGSDMQIGQSVLRELKEHYPHDGARNYSVGDVIGAVSVKLKIR